MALTADMIKAAKRRLSDLKGVHTRWYMGLDTRKECDIIIEMEEIAYSASLYLDGVPGKYLPNFSSPPSQDSPSLSTAEPPA